MKKARNDSVMISAARYGGIAAVTALLLAMAAAGLIMKKIIGQDMIRYLIPAIVAVSVFVPCFIGAKRRADQKLPFALMAAAVYFACCLALKLAFFSGSAGYMVPNAIACFGAALLAGVFGGVSKTRRGAAAIRRKR